MAQSSRAFYDRLAADYHLIYKDWPAAILRRAAALDRLIRGELGDPVSTSRWCSHGPESLRTARLACRPDGLV